MEEKNSIRISFSTALLILAIIVIAIMGYFIYQLNNEKISEMEKVSDLNNQVSNLENTINTLNGKIDSVSNIVNDSEDENILSQEDTNDNKYIEMTEENYKKYTSGKYRFEISDLISNTDGTATIKGRVYEAVELPILTQEQYQDLIDDKTVSLMGYELKANKEDKDEDGKYGGHDLFIESVNDGIDFYVDKKSNGTGTIYYAAEFEIVEGTGIYMQITVDENITTESGEGNIALKEYIKGLSVSHFELKDKQTTGTYREEFTFKNGKCIKIFFPSV